jgi:hypothetical protein
MLSDFVIVAICSYWWRKRNYAVGDLVNGVLGGLVSITGENKCSLSDAIVLSSHNHIHVLVCTLMIPNYLS